MSSRSPLLKRLAVAAIAVGLAATSACSAGQTNTKTSSSQAASDGNKIVVTNCEKERTFEKPVSRIVATSNSTNIGTLLKIGAVDKLAAVSLTKGNDEILGTLYDQKIKDVPRLDSPISLEAVVGAQPDLLIGSYSGLFAGSSGITEEVANNNGIPTYVISDSCRQDPAAGASSKLGTMNPWDAVRADIQNYGKITGNEDKAAAALTEFNDTLAKLENAPKAENKPKVLLFDSGTDQLYTSGHNGPPQGIIDAAGGINVFEDQDTTWFKANWEAVAEKTPDVIVVLDYRKGDPNEVQSKIDTIRSQAALKDLPAVKENRIIVLPLTLFTSGYPNIEAAAQLRAGLEYFGLAPKTDIKGEMPDSLGYGPLK